MAVKLELIEGRIVGVKGSYVGMVMFPGPVEYVRVKDDRG